ncbi:MAG: methionyl-tRNA formyltransferase [Burkholderiales bacterium]|nr:methionyl-tRNA formyltransferase [Burkholderiales bacterium]
MRIVFAGTPEFAATALRAIVAAGARSGWHLPAVYTQPDRPAGRGLKLTASAVKTLAQSHGIEVRQPATLRGAEAAAELAALTPDVLVVAAYGLILPPSILAVPRFGCMNIHASLLPRWRGAAPIQRAILAGDARTGVAIMRMEEGLDTGPVLLETFTAIGARETAGALQSRLAVLGAEAIVHVLRALDRGEPCEASPQLATGITYAHKITPGEAAVDWSRHAIDIDRQVRAFNPAPGAWTIWRDEKLKLWASEVMPLPSSCGAAPGTVILAQGDKLVVACADSALALTEIQRPGGKRMPVAAWLSGGARPAVGERLTSTSTPATG